MINTRMLRAKMLEKDITIDKMADLLGVSRPTLYRKLKNGSFSLLEAAKIANTFDLSNDDICRIFFAEDVA